MTRREPKSETPPSELPGNAPAVETEEPPPAEVPTDPAPAEGEQLTVEEINARVTAASERALLEQQDREAAAAAQAAAPAIESAPALVNGWARTQVGDAIGWKCPECNQTRWGETAPDAPCDHAL